MTAVFIQASLSVCTFKYVIFDCVQLFVGISGEQNGLELSHDKPRLLYSMDGQLYLRTIVFSLIDSCASTGLGHRI